MKYFGDFVGVRARELLISRGLGEGSIAQVFPSNTLCPVFDESNQSGLYTGRGNVEMCTELLECLALKIAGANAPLESAENVAFFSYQ